VRGSGSQLQRVSAVGVDHGKREGRKEENQMATTTSHHHLVCKYYFHVNPYGVCRQTRLFAKVIALLN
jgi:hypothetical protein